MTVFPTSVGLGPPLLGSVVSEPNIEAEGVNATCWDSRWAPTADRLILNHCMMIAFKGALSFGLILVSRPFNYPSTICSVGSVGDGF